ncbi:hypothetical protein ABIE12_001741 [Serratia sp. 509]
MFAMMTNELKVGPHEPTSDYYLITQMQYFLKHSRSNLKLCSFESIVESFFCINNGDDLLLSDVLVSILAETIHGTDNVTINAIFDNNLIAISILLLKSTTNVKDFSMYLKLQ